VKKNNKWTKTANWKLWIGLLISALFLYLAFRRVDFGLMWDALKKANYWYLPPTIFILFFSHYLRVLRWRYLLDPIRRLDISSLFSSLIIGYGANTVTPAHLLLMCLVIFVHPFPDWVVKSGYVMFAATLGLFLLLIFLKRSSSTAEAFLRVLLKPLPERYENTIKGMTDRFLSGIVPLKRWHDYVTVTILSAAIWACYGLALLSPQLVLWCPLLQVMWAPFIFYVKFPWPCLVFPQVQPFPLL